MKSEGYLGRSYLKGRRGDHANAVLTAAGYNLRLVLTWLRLLLRLILAALVRKLMPRLAAQPAYWLIRGPTGDFLTDTFLLLLARRL
jgi:hypothetical protein